MSDLSNRLDGVAVQLHSKGLSNPSNGFLPPRLWEDLRVLLQERYRDATGEPDAILSVTTEAASRLSSDAQAEVAKAVAAEREACAKVAERCAAHVTYKTGLLTEVSDYAIGSTKMQIAAAIRNRTDGEQP